VGFLSFGEDMEMDIGPGLTVVTDPNGVGKSHFGRCPGPLPHGDRLWVGYYRCPAVDAANVAGYIAEAVAQLAARQAWAEEIKRRAWLAVMT